MPDDWKHLREQRRGLRPSAQQLQSAAKEKRRQRRACYEEILEKVYTRVAAKAKMGWVRVLYEVPPFWVGLPPYDREDCVKYVTRAMKKDGYMVEAYGNVVYVSWDPKEKSERDINGGI